MYLTNEEFIILKGLANGLSREEINKQLLKTLKTNDCTMTITTELMAITVITAIYIRRWGLTNS